MFSARPARFRPIQGMANITSTQSPGMMKIETISGHPLSIS